jgi:anti-anti-sigma factor
VNLELRVQSDEDAIILHCGGHITSGDTCHAFRTAVVDLLRRHHNIIVDLGGVDCMDRRGLEALVGLYSSARTAKASVRFVNLTIDVTDSQRNKIQPHTLAG